jgi:hypothetical protein
VLPRRLKEIYRETLWAYLEADDWNNAFRLSQELGWNWIDIVAAEMSARITEAHDVPKNCRS